MTTDSKRLYWVWAAMKGRCSNRRDPNYHNYGGRGIVVCEKWQTFAGFVADMAPRPAGALLDRIDNDGPYSPDNCRWTDRATQNANRRSCIYVDIDGERVTLKEACRRRGLRYRPVVKRVQDRGWTIADALSTPIGERRAA